MKASPRMNAQWESGSEFPGAILEKSAELKYFTTTIAQEPCKNWMRLRPRTQPASDEGTARTRKSQKCGCTPKSAPATSTPSQATRRQSHTSPLTRIYPRRISFLDEKEEETKRWQEKVRYQNLVYFSPPKVFYRTLLGSGKNRSGSPLTPTRKLREGFWGPSRIKPTDIVPEVPKSPKDYLKRQRPNTATVGFSTPTPLVDFEKRPYTAPTFSSFPPMALVSFARQESVARASFRLSRLPGHRSMIRFHDEPDPLEPGGDTASRSRLGTIASVISAPRTSSGERIAKERSSHTLDKIRKFLNQKRVGMPSMTVLSSVPEMSQGSLSERKNSFDPNIVDSLTSKMERPSEENQTGSLDAIDGMPKVMPFPPRFYRRKRNRGMYGVFPSDKPPPLPYTPPHHPPRLVYRTPKGKNDNEAKAAPKKLISLQRNPK